MKTVLYFQATGKVSARQKLEGVYAYGREHGWSVQVIESCVSERKAAELARFWEPDGTIVECGSSQNHFAPVAQARVLRLRAVAGATLLERGTGGRIRGRAASQRMRLRPFPEFAT